MTRTITQARPVNCSIRDYAKAVHPTSNSKLSHNKLGSKLVEYRFFKPIRFENSAGYGYDYGCALVPGMTTFLGPCMHALLS